MRVCSIDGCGKKHYAKGLCLKHYQQTDKFKDYQKRYYQRYHQTDKFKASVKRYQQTDKFKASVKRRKERPDKETQKYIESACLCKNSLFYEGE